MDLEIIGLLIIAIATLLAVILTILKPIKK
jgi:hypothetical protein